MEETTSRQVTSQDKGITSFSLEQLSDMLKEKGQPAFRAKQIFSWIHQKQVQLFDEMSNLSKDLRNWLETEFYLENPTIIKKETSTDGTCKYLLQMRDGNSVEAVLMRYSYGNTLCVSTQVGCRMGCRFCASSKPIAGKPNGYMRNLTAGEILGEVYTVIRESGEPVSRIVMMGIGEPLDNLDNVLQFYALLIHPEGLNVSGRHVTLSTCGVVPMMHQLAEKKLPLTLSVSLHAASDKKRSEMMPVNDAYPLKELLKACREYQDKTGRRISFEYAMVRGVNDSNADAAMLANLVRGMGAHVNLIPINPVDGSPYGTSDEQNIAAFQKRLEELGVNATVRRRLGVDISAACGQLRLQEAAKGDLA